MRARTNRILGLFACLSFSVCCAVYATDREPAPDPIELLDAALNPPKTAFQGRMMVTHWYGKQARVEEVDVSFAPPNRYRWEFLGPDGVAERIVTSDGDEEVVLLTRKHKTLRGSAIKSDSKLMSAPKERELLLKNYTVTVQGRDKVVGRPVWVIDLAPKLPGKQKQRLWIDQETRVVLDTKRYRLHGSYTVRSQYTRFDPQKSLPDSLFDVDSTTGVETDHGLEPDFLTMEELEQSAGKTSRLPRELPGGFAFESANYFDVRSRTVRHLRYTDGLTVLSLFQTDRPVKMPRTETPTPAKETPGSLRLSSAGRVLQWKTDGKHYTLMGDISKELMLKISAGIGQR